MKRYIVVIFLVVLGIGSFSVAGVVLGMEHREATTQLITITKIVEVEVEVPKLVYSNDFRYFTSYAELRIWLDSVKTEIRAAVQPDWNCQSYAWWLFERAIEDGYLMAKYGIRAETYNAVFERQITGAHAINATFINNHTYLIEPQGLKVFPDFEIED